MMRRWTIGTIVALLLSMGLAGDARHAAGAESASTGSVGDVGAILDAAATRHGLTPRFFRCLAWAESRFQPGVTSWAGYMGLLQFDWPTWRYGSRLAGIPWTSPYDAESAAEVGALLIARGEVRRWPPAARCGSPWW